MKSEQCKMVSGTLFIWPDGEKAFVPNAKSPLWTKIVCAIMIIIILCLAGIEVKNLEYSFLDSRISHSYNSQAEDSLKPLLKEASVRLRVSDDQDMSTINDEYIGLLMKYSNEQYDGFFRNTEKNLRKSDISIFFIKPRQWDGQKICGRSWSAGCNYQHDGKNVIYVSTTGNMLSDLSVLNHERAHAYFLNQPEIIAGLMQYLLENQHDLSARDIRLYNDPDGMLRVSE